MKQKFNSVPDNSAAAHAAQRKEFYEAAIQLFGCLYVLGLATLILVSLLIIDHIVSYF